MSSHLFHSDLPTAAVMSSEDFPSVLESDPFSPLPDVSLDAIFPQLPITGIPNPAPPSPPPPTHLPSHPNGHAAGQLQRSFSCGANVRMERCSAEERKEKIERYRAKRYRRNFHRTVKYECRKTSADGRRRVGGRFASNVEVRGVHGSDAYANGDDALVEKQDP